MEKETRYNQILEEAKNDPDVIGLILVAGRGKGFVTEHSDYDVYMIVSDGKLEVAKEKYKSGNKVDIFLHTLSSFIDYASWGSEYEWDRYNFTYVKAQIDKTGEIQKIIDEKGTLPKDKMKDFVIEAIDGYINLYYRSLKNDRDGDRLAAHLDAAESVSYLLNAIFGLEQRLRPYNKYLQWELEKYPLKKLPWITENFLKKLEEIMTTGNIETQKEVFNKVKELCQQNGYAEAIDSWNGCYLG